MRILCCQNETCSLHFIDITRRNYLCQKIRTSSQWHALKIKNMSEKRGSCGIFGHATAQSGCCRFQIVLINVNLLRGRKKKPKSCLGFISTNCNCCSWLPNGREKAAVLTLYYFGYFFFKKGQILEEDDQGK